MSSFEKYFNMHNTPENYITYCHLDKEKRIYGGSFFMCPRSNNFFSINLMMEHQLPCDKWLPIKDFNVPYGIKDFVDTFEYILNMDEDKNVYVGCFGGIGRTGLFMACFLKYIGVEDPLLKVRSEYNKKALESDLQLQYLNDFPQKELKNNYKL